jgi:hypothetical protein
MVSKVQLLIATICLTAIQPVLAQGMQAGAMQSMTPSSAIGPEQDSLLPPEVVPLDPNAASQMQARQAAASAPANMAAAQSNNVPGLSGAQPNPYELRKQALGQLLGDQTTIPASAMKPWRAGQGPATQAGGPVVGGAGNGQMSASMPPISGMPPGMMPKGIGSAPAQNLGDPNYQMANNQGAPGQNYYAQSQTLTGGSQNQPMQQDTRRGGFSNRLSSFSTMGMGLLNPLKSGLMMAGPFSRW